MNIRSTIWSLLVLLVVSSCDIARYPKEEMAASEALKSVSDLKNWERDILVQLRGKQGDIYEMVQDIQADQLLVTQNESNSFPASVAWESATASDYKRQDVYIGYYQMILNINYVFDHINDVKVTDEEKEVFNLLLGRLHFYRAYAYANLALRYGTPYSAATASTDLCVPLHLNYSLTAKLPRSTNEKVYNQILNVDIKEAKTLLANVSGKPEMDTPSLDAVKALEARVYLYMGDWSNAYKVAKELISSGTYPLVDPTAKNFENMWLHDTSSEEILLLSVSRPDEKTTINWYFHGATDKFRSDEKTKGVNYPDFIPTQKIVDLYSDADLRKGAYFEKQECNITNKYWADFYLVSKRKGNPKYHETYNANFTWWNGFVPNSMHRPKIFRVAEQYLIAMEAAYQLGNTNEALTLLNALRKSRGLAEVSLSGNELYKEIQDERTRELAFEGFRLWDIRRWNLPVERDTPQLPNGLEVSNIYKPSAIKSYPANHPRMLWPIPANDINTNPNIATQQNPGW